MDGIGQHRGHQGAGAAGRPHPQDVVVAPLDVHTVVLQQGVHDDVRPGPAVKDVSHDVHMVHRHALDHQGDRLNEPVRLSQVDDGVDDILIVVPLVRLIIVGMEQLVDDIGVILGQSLTHLGAGILGGHPAADLDEAVQGDPVPLVHVRQQLVELFQLLLRVVDQGTQLIPVRPGDGGGKQVVHLFLDDAGAGVQNVEKCLILPVYVRDEVLCALGQVQNGLKIDDLTAGGLYRGILLGQKL